MENFKWRTLVLWAFAPTVAYLLGYFRREDLALGIIAFLCIWLYSSLVGFFIRVAPEMARSLVSSMALILGSLLGVVVSFAVQLNYFTHWFTLGGAS